MVEYFLTPAKATLVMPVILLEVLVIVLGFFLVEEEEVRCPRAQEKRLERFSLAVVCLMFGSEDIF